MSLRTNLLVATTAALLLMGLAAAQIETGLKDIEADIDRGFLPFGAASPPVPPPIPRNLTPPRTVELLADVLARESGTRKVRLVQDLGTVALPQAVPHVRAAMTDADPLVRAQAAHAASLLADPSALPELRRLLADANARVRREAVLAGAALGDGGFAAAGMGDAEAAVVIAALRAASSPEHAALIAQRIGGWPPAVQLQALDALGRLRAQAHADAVAAFLKAEVSLRRSAVAALARMQARDHVRAIEALLADAHPTVRRTAAEALGELLAADRRNAVGRTLLNDADLTVRQAGADLLAAAPSDDALSALLAQLGAGYPPLRQSARRALVAMGAAAIKSAAALLTHADPRRREDGSWILGRLRSDVAIDAHVALLEGSDWPLVAQAADSLGRIGNRAAGPAVAALAARTQRSAALGQESPQAEAFVAAMVAAGRLGETSVLPVARRIMQGHQGMALEPLGASIWAVGVLSPPPQRGEAAAALMRIYETRREAGDGDRDRQEILKALGNMMHRPSLDTLRRIAATHSAPEQRYFAHLAADRIEGRDTAYTPPDAPWIARTMIEDRTPRSSAAADE